MSEIKEVQRGIQKQLRQLVISAQVNILQRLVVSIKDEVEEEVPGEEVTALELYDFIVDFVKSDQLASLEDQGLSRLLHFNDLIMELQQPTGTSVEECELVAVAEAELSTGSLVGEMRVDSQRSVRS